MVNIHFSNHFGRIREIVHSNTGMKKRKNKHKECPPSRISKDELTVQDLIDSFDEFKCIPFHDYNSSLSNLESELEVSVKLVEDYFENAYQVRI